MKKSIDIIVKYFYPVAAGIETNILETYSILAKKGWDITIHTSKDTLTQKNVLSDSEVLHGLEVKRYPFRWYGFWPQLNWDKSEVVCLHNFNIMPHMLIMLYVLYRKLLGRKKTTLILTPHGGFTPDWLIFPPIIAAIKKLYHLTLGVMLINLIVDGVRAVSEWEKQEIIKRGVKPSIVKTIANGIEDEAYMDLDAKASLEIKEKVKEYGKYIIQIGRIYNIKNYETTIKALTKVPKDINFVIVGPVGSDDYLKKLKQLIESLNLQKRIFFAGVVRGIDKYYLIKHAQLMVHMARWESFCNAVHEGMSQGLVCVVANNTALPYLVKDGQNGFLVETMDVQGLAEKINYILQNNKTGEIKKIKENSRLFGLNNSWRNVADKMEQWFKNNLIQLKII